MNAGIFAILSCFALMGVSAATFVAPDGSASAGGTSWSDAGADDPGLESKPNGKHRNLGYWGGTPWATMTSTPPGLQVIVR